MHAVNILSLILILIVTVSCSRSEFDFGKEAEVNPQLPALSKSTIWISENNRADGMTPALVMVTIQNAFGHCLKDVDIELEVSGSHNVIVPCTRTDSSGQSRCKIYSTRSEVKRIKVRNIGLWSETMFMSVPPSHSALAIVTSGEVGRLSSGHKVLLSSGFIESPTVLKDSANVVRVRSTLHGSMAGN